MADRDVDLGEWLDGVGFHPANTEIKQAGHEAVRNLIAQIGAVLHWLLPAGRDKSLAFTALEDALMRANRALAVKGGPRITETQTLLDLIRFKLVAGVEVPEDERIAEYKAEQVAAGDGGEQDEERGGEPHETYRAEIVGDNGFSLGVVGGDRYVQVGTLAPTHEAAVAGVNSDSPREPGGSRGLWYTMDDAESVQRVVNEILTAADRAGVGTFTDLTA